MLTRSTSTPGTPRISAKGSRDVGIFVSSSDVKLVAVPVALVSTMGVSPLTVIVSATDAILRVIGSSTVLPTATMMPSRTSVEKPGSTTVTLYRPGARFRKRKSPLDSVVYVCVASTPCNVTRTPGSTPPGSSFTTPLTVPLKICALANALGAKSATSIRTITLDLIRPPENRINVEQFTDALSVSSRSVSGINQYPGSSRLSKDVMTARKECERARIQVLGFLPILVVIGSRAVSKRAVPARPLNRSRDRHPRAPTHRRCA